MTLLEYVLLAIVTLFFGMAAANRFTRQRRSGSSRGEFADAFRSEGVPTQITNVVYDYYRLREGVPPSPNDSFDALSLSADEIDDDALALVRRLGLHEPSRNDLKGCASTLKTIRGMVAWLDCLRRVQSR